MIQITKAQIEQAKTEQATKIILVTYHNSYEQEWFPFTLESFETIIAHFDWIETIEIIERNATNKQHAQIEQATKTEQATKIILVTYHNSYQQEWYPYTLESFETIIAHFEWIETIENIERGV